VRRRVELPLVLERARSAGTLREDAAEDAIIDWLQGRMRWLTSRDDLDDSAMGVLLRTFVVPSLFRLTGR
jgi:hypothetical protein